MAHPRLCIPCHGVPRVLAQREALLARLTRWSDNAGLALLMLAIGALLFRPADLVPALGGLPIYEACILGCLACSLSRVLPQLTSLPASAVTALMVLFVAAVILSHLSHLNTWDARLGGEMAAKVCILFLLVVGLVRSPARLQALLLAATASVLGMTVLALLNYHHLVYVPALESVVQGGLDGSEPILRLCGTGIFNDPNDYALILVLCTGVSVCTLGERRLGRWRLWAVIPLAIFGYALFLTHSRGGLVSAAAGALAYAFARLGWRNALPVTVALGLVLLMPMWGRQTELNLEDPEDTFQARLELWSSSLDVFRAHPLFGLGQGKLTDEIGQVTHNSFLHAFAELGLFGGVIFIGAFFVAIRGVWLARPRDQDLARLRPCILAAVVGYGAGMLALSRCYTAPVQLILGLATAFLVLASQGGGAVVPRLDARCLGRIATVGVLFLGATYTFIRVMIYRGL